MLSVALTVGVLFVFLLNPSFIFKVAGGEPPQPGVEDAFDRDRVNIALLGWTAMRRGRRSRGSSGPIRS